MLISPIKALHISELALATVRPSWGILGVAAC